MQRQQQQSFLSVLLTACLLLQVLLPFFATYQPSATAASTSVFGEKILLCTGDGFRWVKWEELQSGKELPPPHAKYKCPLCYTAAHNTFLGTAPAQSDAPQITPVVSAGDSFATASVTPRDLIWLRHNTRAPPASLV